MRLLKYGMNDIGLLSEEEYVVGECHDFYTSFSTGTLVRLVATIFLPMGCLYRNEILTYSEERDTQQYIPMSSLTLKA